MFTIGQITKRQTPKTKELSNWKDKRAGVESVTCSKKKKGGGTDR